MAHTLTPRRSERRRFTTLPDYRRAASGVEPQEAMYRCYGAARLALRGDQFSSDDRLDCASHLLVQLMAERPGAEHFPDAAVGMSRLYGMASNYRRSLERKRTHDSEHAARLARETGFTTYDVVGESQSGREPSASAAHVHARDLLAALGLPRVGRAYPLAYEAARSAQGLEPAAVAAELGYSSQDVARVQRSRARKAIPSATHYPAHLHADLLGVGVDEGGAPEVAREVVSTGSARGSSERYHDGRPAPIKLRRTRTRKPWDGRRSADWTKDLRPATSARLATAARLQRERAAARDESERRTLRLSAGLPG